MLVDDKETSNRWHVIPQFYDRAGEESNEQGTVLREMYKT